MKVCIETKSRTQRKVRRALRKHAALSRAMKSARVWANDSGNDAAWNHLYRVDASLKAVREGIVDAGAVAR